MTPTYEQIAAQLHHLLDALGGDVLATDLDDTPIAGEPQIRQAVAALLENHLSLVLEWVNDGAGPEDRRVRATYLAAQIADRHVLLTLATPHGIDAYAALLYVALTGEQAPTRNVAADAAAPVPSEAHIALAAIAHLAAALIVRPTASGDARAAAAAAATDNARAIAAAIDFLDGRATRIGRALYRALQLDQVAIALAETTDGARLLRALQYRADV